MLEFTKLQEEKNIRPLKKPEKKLAKNKMNEEEKKKQEEKQKAINEAMEKEEILWQYWREVAIWQNWEKNNDHNHNF